jgi:hypothetical protein
MSYYNTNRESGDRLARSEARAQTQDDRVLVFFQDHPGTGFAPHEVQSVVLPDAPLTSVRRAISNLTKRGLLVKTTHMLEGTFDKEVHTWVLAS